MGTICGQNIPTAKYPTSPKTPPPSKGPKTENTNWLTRKENPKIDSINLEIVAKKSEIYAKIYSSLTAEETLKFDTKVDSPQSPEEAEKTAAKNYPLVKNQSPLLPQPPTRRK